MNNYSYFDMHCDTLYNANPVDNVPVYENKGMQSFRQMAQASQMAQFFAIFFHPEEFNSSKLPDDELFETLRNYLYEQTAAHSDIIAMAHNYQEVMNNWNAGKSSAILTIEDGRMIQGSMEKLYEVYEKGVRAIALTWNFANCFGYPNSRDPSVMEKGLTPFGKEAVEEMQRIGILVDVSHLSDGGFYDVADICRKPFIASHSNCREVTGHARNMTDPMIRILAEHGGVSGINLCPDFTMRDPADLPRRISRVRDLAAHVLHFINVGGEECVGLGSDFDGITGELEIGHPNEMQLLFRELEKAGLTPRQLDKIASGNVLRVLKDSMK